MEELYRTNKDFKEYVDRYCRDYGLCVAEALKHRLVIEYAEYLRERDK